MKKIIIVLIAFVAFATSASSQVSAQRSYGAFLGVLDTLDNAESKTYTTTIAGNKSVINYQVHTLKISGTIAGSIKLYVSADGTNWPSAAMDSITLVDGSTNYQLRKTGNYGVKHKIVIATTGTSSMSNRTYLFWRD